MKRAKPGRPQKSPETVKVQLTITLNPDEARYLRSLDVTPSQWVSKQVKRALASD